MNDLALIKKYYGENMMHLCRKLFPTIIEKGVLFEIMDNLFNRSKDLYYDIIDYLEQFSSVINYVYNCRFVKEEKEINIIKTPKELLDEAGYILYECHTEEDIQSFRKYYYKSKEKIRVNANDGIPGRVGEELCTFNGGRLDSCYVFFAVKKNVDEIKREDFKNPERDDEYGTSVLSIQFSRGSYNSLSIKNRYNHSVDNPDATLSNNLDRIIPGLTSSFKRYYKLSFCMDVTNNFEIPNYVVANDGKFYKYNFEIDNIYYCPNNLIIDNYNVIRYYQGDNAARYILMDYFILDIKEKRIFRYGYEYGPSYKDSFIDFFNEHKIQNIEIKKYTDYKQISLIIEDNKKVIIEVDKANNIVSYDNKYIYKIDDNFLYTNLKMKSINIPNVISIGSHFLYSNEDLKNIQLDNVYEIGNDFLSLNKNLEVFEAQNVISIGDNFLFNNLSMTFINLLKTIKIGRSFMSHNEILNCIVAPNLEFVDTNCLFHNKEMKRLFLPKVINIQDGFMYCNESMKEFYAPNLINISTSFLELNYALLYAEIDNLCLKDLLRLRTRILFNKICNCIVSIGKVKDINYKLIKNKFKTLKK